MRKFTNLLLLSVIELKPVGGEILKIELFARPDCLCHCYGIFSLANNLYKFPDACTHIYVNYQEWSREYSSSASMAPCGTWARLILRRIF